MGDRDAPPEPGPARLTKRALFNLRLEEMRRRGDPIDGISEPSASDESSAADRERAARALAIVRADASEPDPDWIAEQERQAKFYMDRAADRRRQAREAGQWVPPTPTNDSTPSQIEVECAYSNHESDLDGLHACSRRSKHSKNRISRDAQLETRTGSGNQRISQTSGPGYNNRRFRQPAMPQWDKEENKRDPELSAEAREGSDWRHSAEFDILRDEMLEAAKFRPEGRSLYRTFDMNAFAGEPKPKRHGGDHDVDVLSIGEEVTENSAVPVGFPPHRSVDALIELGAYLASSSYVVSLGGPPLADLKYGIIVVPAGEEDLLFNGYGDDAALSPEVTAQIYAKSKITQKENVKELQQKKLHEWVNGVPFEPEIDDDDREFYRRRWRRRNGLPSDDGSELAVAETDDNQRSAGQGNINQKSRSIEAGMPISSFGQEDPRYSRHSRRSLSVSKLDNETSPVPEDLPMLANRKKQHSSNRGQQSSPLASTSDGVGEVRSIREEPAQNKASTRPKNFQAADQRDDHSVTRAELTAVQCKHCRPLDGDQTGGKSSDQRDQPRASTPTTLRNTASEEIRMSPEACAVLEALLGGGEKKRRGPRRIVHSLLAGASPKKFPDTTIKRQDVLREVSRAVERLGNNELCENPGIDRRIWEAARKDAATKATI